MLLMLRREVERVLLLIRDVGMTAVVGERKDPVSFTVPLAVTRGWVGVISVLVKTYNGCGRGQVGVRWGWETMILLCSWWRLMLMVCNVIPCAVVIGWCIVEESSDVHGRR